ncbi:MarR family winged helix-turn-helix transcriptional regulator [Streptomyces sp. FH025]|uniref:MarR family winged helix-turn-helix transcriptional regulator n=1 Tax=Streptomyces sp. FH025 TaxID=2815937 RepID=UPI001A9E639C|nr:MarR family transcriptional regulator [Streptomyces sp. FH025]MBO1419892.1 MarR family transcriptional regulator [Streptomyces sp. FH025]
MADHVDRVVAQWAAERPDLDVSPMEVFGRLKRLYRLVDAELNRTFAEHGLDAASFDVLATLKRSGPPYRLTPTGLMQSAMVTSGAITQRLDRLEARGLVTRTRSDLDRRSRDVELTPEGHALIERALPAHLATEHRILADLDDTGTAALVEAMRTLLVTLDDGPV